MANALISQIVIGSTTYDIKDAYARQLISDIGDAVYWIGVTTTELTDGGTTNPITVSGESVTAKLGGMAQYSGEEFIWNGSAWQSIGKNNFGDLAFADTASASYTPAGTIEVTPTTDSVYSITDVGTLPVVDPQTDSVYSITDVGTLPSVNPTDTTVYSITDVGTLPSVDPTDTTVYSITDVGTLPTVSPTTDTVYSITDVGTLPTFTVSGEVLTFTAGTLPTKGTAQTVVSDVGYTAGTLPTKGSAQTVLTGVGFDAGSLPTKGDGQTVLTGVGFDAGTLPTKGSAQTVVTDIGYTAGTLPTKGSAQTVMTGASAAFTGTAATITVEPDND